MSSTPVYGSTRLMRRAVLSAATTDKTGATVTNIVDIIATAAVPAAGAEIQEIIVKADGDPADCTVLIFIHNGTDYRLYDEFDIGNPTAGSTTVAGYPEGRLYSGLFLENGQKLAAAITVVPTAGNVNVWAAGWVLT